MSRNQNRKGGGKRGRPDEWATDSRDLTALDNAAFTQYYKGNVVPADEWDAFMASLKTGLPMSIRVNVSVAQSDDITKYVFEQLAKVFNTQQMAFFPQHKAMQCSVSRGDLKRNLEFKHVKKLISALNEGGYLTRQETVSMLPPLALDVKPAQRVLDLCAAPGSKTSQILESLLADADSGVVVANDVNASRLDVLHHQTNRIAGAHPHLIITNYDATRFPLLPSEQKFDRVLCDVMCSGDGTLRKSVDMWPRWNTLQGADLHTSQSRVLLRGMLLCKKGGRVVYSTCSLNPVEDEAVVSECLRQANGAFRLVDVSALLPGLRSYPGLTTWSMLSKDLSTTLHTFAEAQAYVSSQQNKGFQYKASMFPDTAQLQRQNIQYARRILPHQQDTGGFFVAALECVEEMTPRSADAGSPSGEVPIKPLSSTMREAVGRALGLPSTFLYDRLLFRSEHSRSQKVYYANPAAIALSSELGNRVVHIGSKVFESFAKYTNEKLRISSDGVANLAPLVPPSFLLKVDPRLIIDLAGDTAMTLSTFAERSQHPLDQLTAQSFILTCDLDLTGPLYVAAERSAVHGKIVARVAEWHVTLCKLHLGLPLVLPVTAEEKADDTHNSEQLEGMKEGEKQTNNNNRSKDGTK